MGAGAKLGSQASQQRDPSRGHQGPQFFPNFSGTCLWDLGVVLYVTPASTGGVPTTAAGTVPPPAAAPLPTERVGLENVQILVGNEEFYW